MTKEVSLYNEEKIVSINGPGETAKVYAKE